MSIPCSQSWLMASLLAQLHHHMDHAVLELGGDRETGVVEDAERLRVVRHGVRDEPSDAAVCDPRRQHAEHGRSQPVALPGVGHDESNLCSVGVVDPIESGDADDGAVDPRDDGLAVAVVDVCESVDLVGAELGITEKNRR